jgi:hypothetical protein
VRALEKQLSAFRRVEIDQPLGQRHLDPPAVQIDAAQEFFGIGDENFAVRPADDQERNWPGGAPTRSPM